MTKSELFTLINNDLDGDGLVITDNDLLAQAIDRMEDLETDDGWQAILEEETEDEEWE